MIGSSQHAPTPFFEELPLLINGAHIFPLKRAESTAKTAVFHSFCLEFATNGQFKGYSTRLTTAPLAAQSQNL